MLRIPHVLRRWCADAPRPDNRPQRPAVPRLECLEDRTLPSASAVPLDVLLAAAGSLAAPTAGGAAGPFTPAQIRQAYGFDRIAVAGGAVAGDGSGQTIAIVDAFDDPTIFADANAFSAAFGLPAFNAGGPTLTRVNQNGGTVLPATDPSGGWEMEEALDVEWAHAMAPGANILLVEADSPSDAALFAGVRYAADRPGVSVVSMSFGTPEAASLGSLDSVFRTPAGHPGVTFVAASGDNGTVSYPASSPNVLAVGGTSLTLGSSGDYLRESAWNGSGGGASSFEAEPAYQRAVQSTGMRASPDVAFDADPGSGYWIYDSSAAGGPWIAVGGTSAGAPQWAALVAIADQGRALQGLSSLDGPGQTLPMLYSLPSSDFHDVTGGANQAYTAAAGYDMVTGLGSPFADRIAAALAGGMPAPPALIAATSSPAAAAAGPSVSPPPSAPPAPPPAPSPFDEAASDALFVALGVRTGDFSTILRGVQEFQSLYFNSPPALRGQLWQTFFLDAMADLFGSIP